MSVSYTHLRLNLLPLMQEINPSVKNTLIDTSNYLNDVATIYNLSLIHISLSVATSTFAVPFFCPEQAHIPMAKSATLPVSYTHLIMRKKAAF